MTRLLLIFILLNGPIFEAFAANKILFVLTSHSQLGDTDKKTGFYLSELTHPYYLLDEAGYEIEVASIQGGKAPIDPISINKSDKDNQKFFNGSKLLNKVNNSKKIKEINYKDYQAIVFSGGHGTMWDFRSNIHVQSLVKNIYENNGIVAAVCHGPSALVDVKLSNGKYIVEGKKVAVFSNIEEKIAGLTDVVPFLLQSTLEEQGAIDESGLIPWRENAVADQRLITGQNPQSAHKLGQLIIAELEKLNANS